MYFHYLLFVAFFMAQTRGAQIPTPAKPKTDAVSVLVQATNNTKVPSISYTVDAVNCLEEVYSIFDNDNNRTLAWAELFQEKHPGTWNVAAGYTSLFSHAEIYIEAQILGGDDDKKSKKKDDKETASLFRIFSAD